MKVTTKGQVTIPMHLREAAGIVPGCDVEFHHEKGRLYIRKAANSSRGRDLVARWTGQGNGKLSTDEIMALTRGED